MNNYIVIAFILIGILTFNFAIVMENAYAWLLTVEVTYISPGDKIYTIIEGPHGWQTWNSYEWTDIRTSDTTAEFQLEVSDYEFPVNEDFEVCITTSLLKDILFQHRCVYYTHSSSGDQKVTIAAR